MKNSCPTPCDVEMASLLVEDLVASADRLAVLLDYDGTLVDITTDPRDARPDDDLLALLDALSRRRSVTVHLVSGRPRATMEDWFGSLPLGLHAEHGLWSRWGGTWSRRTAAPAAWFEALRSVLETVTARVPGAALEVKTESYAWHHRLADPAATPAAEQLIRQAAVAAGDDVEVLRGHQVLELRRRGVDKGCVVRDIASAAVERTAYLAMGDDTTDEDMFAALPLPSLALRIGPGATCAQHRLGGPVDVRAILRAIACRPGSTLSPRSGCSPPTGRRSRSSRPRSRPVISCSCSGSSPASASSSASSTRTGGDKNRRIARG